MSSLKTKLKEKIPEVQNEIKELLKNKGDMKIGEVTVSQAYSGMRGVKAFVCDTSSVSADKGLVIRGLPLLDITNILPEEVFYLLLTGELPTPDQIKELKKEFASHLEIPNYVWRVLEGLPKDSHPMTMFNTGILAMQRESLFQKRYDKGMQKDEYWEAILDDGIRLLAKLPALGAGIYRLKYDKGAIISADPKKDWAGNFVHMTGLPDNDGSFHKLMQLYFMLHCDHEGGM